MFKSNPKKKIIITRLLIQKLAHIPNVGLQHHILLNQVEYPFSVLNVIHQILFVHFFVDHFIDLIDYFPEFLKGFLLERLVLSQVLHHNDVRLIF